MLTFRKKSIYLKKYRTQKKNQNANYSKTHFRWTITYI